jgi:dihydropteroate synthase
LIGTGRPASSPRAFEAQRRQRVDLAVDLTDALLQHIQKLERRDVAGSQLVDDVACGFADQVLRQLFYSYAYCVVIASAAKQSRLPQRMHSWIASLRSQ